MSRTVAHIERLLAASAAVTAVHSPLRLRSACTAATTASGADLAPLGLASEGRRRRGVAAFRCGLRRGRGVFPDPEPDIFELT